MAGSNVAACSSITLAWQRSSKRFVRRGRRAICAKAIGGTRSKDGRYLACFTSRRSQRLDGPHLGEIAKARVILRPAIFRVGTATIGLLMVTLTLDPKLNG